MTPIDDESNRLGDLSVRGDKGSVYYRLSKKGRGIYYAWPNNERRGYRTEALEQAILFLNLEKPIGCNDYEGKVRAGRLIERLAGGEVWKHDSEYFVWRGDRCIPCLTLKSARESAQ